MKVAFIALSCLTFLLCCSPKLAPDNNWAEGKWILIELREVPVQISGNDSKDAHIEFTPSSKRYQGFGGCNRISGTYTIDKNKIIFMPAVTEHAACPDVLFENTFLSLLDDSEKYELSDSMMALKAGNKTIMKFKRKL